MVIYLIWGVYTRPLPGPVMLEHLRLQPKAGAKLLVGFPGSLSRPDFFCSSQFPWPSIPICAALGCPIRWVNVAVGVTTAIWFCSQRKGITTSKIHPRGRESRVPVLSTDSRGGVGYAGEM